jgi:cell wall-associated NlpC family hydrolase
MAAYRRVLARSALIAVALCVLVQTPAPVAAATTQTEYDQVYATAVSKLGDQWKFRARGPNRFDCSGLVWYAFHENDLQDRIGGYRSVAGYFRWFKSRGLVSRGNPRLGDLVVWGRNQHIGIYVGDGMAISTLVTRRGVSITPIRGYLGIRFKAFLHVDITRPGQ